MKLEEIKPIYIVKLPPMGSTEDEKLSIGNYDEANLYYGNLACTEIKGYSENQMQEYAKGCVRAALKEYVGPYSEKKASSIISRVVK
jgi:hypothetical protein